MDILTLEVGSTITKANAFELLPEGRFEHLAQGIAATSISSGDVGIGVEAALAVLNEALPRALEDPQYFVNSSAAGGLRMTVHGLTFNMTARAAREAALGAGAIIKQITADALDEYDLAEIKAIQPNIILLAGGVDYGEKRIVVQNAKAIASLGPIAPVIYAGNIAIRAQIKDIFEHAGIELMLAENVFPAVDQLNIEPVRVIIHEIFNKHIVHAPGMSRLAELTQAPVLPTPGAVLLAAKLFAEALGDVLVIDVGGATTDVHSVTEGSLEWTSRLTDPEPVAKRTVEGDLGVFVNAANILALANDPEWEAEMGHLMAMPQTEQEMNLTRWLTKRAVETAIRRHAGQVSDLYTPSGKIKIVRGKDLTAVQWLVGTGGALTHLNGGEEILRGICMGAGQHLLPTPETKVIIDGSYRFSALGTLAHHYPEEVKASFVHWLRHSDVY